MVFLLALELVYSIVRAVDLMPVETRSIRNHGQELPCGQALCHGANVRGWPNRGGDQQESSFSSIVISACKKDCWALGAVVSASRLHVNSGTWTHLSVMWPPLGQTPILRCRRAVLTWSHVVPRDPEFLPGAYKRAYKQVHRSFPAGGVSVFDATVAPIFEPHSASPLRASAGDKPGLECIARRAYA